MISEYLKRTNRIYKWTLINLGLMAGPLVKGSKKHHIRVFYGENKTKKNMQVYSFSA